MTDRTVSFRFPEKLIQVIETRSKVIGKSKTEVVVETLSQAFRSSPPPLSSIPTLKRQLSEFQNQLTTLSTQLTTILDQTELRTLGQLAIAIKRLILNRHVLEVNENSEQLLDNLAEALAEYEQTYGVIEIEGCSL